MIPPADAVGNVLKTAVRSRKTPGLQYVAVSRSSTVFEAHEGLADIATGRPVLARTAMMAYSMSKTIAAAAVLQLVEAGRLRLDAPVARSPRFCRSAGL